MILASLATFTVTSGSVSITLNIRHAHSLRSDSVQSRKRSKSNLLLESILIAIKYSLNSPGMVFGFEVFAVALSLKIKSICQMILTQNLLGFKPRIFKHLCNVLIQFVKLTIMLFHSICNHVHYC